MKTKYTKKQFQAIENLIDNLLELDDKPHRLFRAIREFAWEVLPQKDFSDEKYKAEVVDSIEETEAMFRECRGIGNVVGDIVRIKRKVLRQVVGYSEGVQKRDDIKDEYAEGYVSGAEKALDKLCLELMKELFPNQ